MTAELYWLTLTVLMTSLFWVPYFLNRVATRGLWPAIQGTTPETGALQSPWALRAMKAHDNAVANLALFAPAVVVAHLLHVSTPLTQAAAAVYFFARLAHFIVYAAAVPLGRTLTFTAGWAALMAIVLSILGWI
jgi:uncharacterized MAPEG superfamily protein